MWITKASSMFYHFLSCQCHMSSFTSQKSMHSRTDGTLSRVPLVSFPDSPKLCINSFRFSFIWGIKEISKWWLLFVIPNHIRPVLPTSKRQIKQGIDIVKNFCQFLCENSNSKIVLMWWLLKCQRKCPLSALQIKYFNQNSVSCWLITYTYTMSEHRIFPSFKQVPDQAHRTGSLNLLLSKGVF